MDLTPTKAYPGHVRLTNTARNGRLVILLTPEEQDQLRAYLSQTAPPPPVQTLEWGVGYPEPSKRGVFQCENEENARYTARQYSVKLYCRMPGDDWVQVITP